jgi:hypothetical protein
MAKVGQRLENSPRVPDAGRKVVHGGSKHERLEWLIGVYGRSPATIRAGIFADYTLEGHELTLTEL